MKTIEKTINNVFGTNPRTFDFINKEEAEKIIDDIDWFDIIYQTLNEVCKGCGTTVAELDLETGNIVYAKYNNSTDMYKTTIQLYSISQTDNTDIQEYLDPKYLSDYREYENETEENDETPLPLWDWLQRTKIGFDAYESEEGFISDEMKNYHLETDYKNEIDKELDTFYSSFDEEDETN